MQTTIKFESNKKKTLNKKKIIKFVIGGAIIVIIGSIIYINGEQIMDFGRDLFEKFFPTDQMVSAFNSNGGDIVDKLHQIGDPYKCYDTNWLEHIYNTEQACKLKAGELFGLVANESSLNNITKMDGSSLSYGVTQIKLPTAKIMYEALRLKGVALQMPTAALLQDKYYAVTLSGKYLQYLHSIYTDQNVIYHFWNLGNATAHAATHFIYEYTINMADHIAKFSAILGK
jgi:hypothetical protein